MFEQKEQPYLRKQQTHECSTVNQCFIETCCYLRFIGIKDNDPYSFLEMKIEMVRPQILITMLDIVLHGRNCHESFSDTNSFLFFSVVEKRAQLTLETFLQKREVLMNASFLSLKMKNTDPHPNNHNKPHFISLKNRTHRLKI